MIPKQTADARATSKAQLLYELDQICDRFEEAWRNRQHPIIEDYLIGPGEPLRSQLLRELVALEISYRRDLGESPLSSEYESRFTSDTATVREAFECSQATAPVETAPLHRSSTPPGHLAIRCPSCHTPMQVAVDTSLTELFCNTCGSHFSLVNQGHATQRAPPLSQLGHFELIERLGVGGFGSVWKARDKELDRTVAIKIPRQGSMTAEEQARFFHEARAAAQLCHPNIVSVHEVGRDGESVYIVSDFVSGVTLDEWLTGQQLTCREAAELSIKIAAALHHAHEAGVIHRDLKPANIIIDIDLEPHLMDFGLARRDAGEVTVTLDGQVLGTPAYMSPEQAQGEAHQADRRSDVYSLGVILFQLLTGEIPFRGNARMLMHQVIHDDPPSLHKLNANVSKDLETITLKCLEKEPGRRYQTAGELAAELRRFVAGESILARPLSRLERGWRLCQRRPLVAGLSAAIVCLLIGATLSATVAAARFRSLAQEREQALVKETSARREAEDVTNFALEMLQTPSRLREGPYSGPYYRALSIAELFQESAERVRERFAEQPAVATRLLSALAQSLGELGEYKASAKLASESVAPSQLANGRDSVATLKTERLFARCLYNTGHREEALNKYQELASRAEIALGTRHPIYLALCTDNAMIYAQTGKPQAIEWIEKAVRHYSTELSEEDPQRRYIANTAGWVYCILTRNELGLKYFQESLRLERKYAGPLAYDTLRVMHANVAWALTELGRFDEAIDIQKEALALFRKKYPNTPARWLWPQSYLVYRYDRAGRFDEAFAAATEFLTVCRDNGENPDDYEVWTTWQLHDNLCRQGRLEDATVLAALLADCLRQVLGENDPAVFRATLRHLTTAAKHADVDDQAERLVDEVREVFRSQRQILGDEHAEVADTAVLWSSCLVEAPAIPRRQWDDLLEWCRIRFSRKQTKAGDRENTIVDSKTLLVVAHLASYELKHKDEKPTQQEIDLFRETAAQIISCCHGLSLSDDSKTELVQAMVAAAGPITCVLTSLEQEELATRLVEDTVQFAVANHSKPVLSTSTLGDLALDCIAANRFNLATRLVNTVMERSPDNASTLYNAAIASLGQENAGEYQKYCEEMLTRFRGTNEYGIAERIGYACVPGPLTSANPEEVVRCARVTGQHRLVVLLCTGQESTSRRWRSLTKRQKLEVPTAHGIMPFWR